MRQLFLLCIFFLIGSSPVLGVKKYIFTEKEYSDYVRNLLESNLKRFQNVVFFRKKNPTSFFMQIDFSLGENHNQLKIDLLKPPYHLTEEMKEYARSFLSKHRLITVKTDYLIFMRNHFFDIPKPITYVWNLTLRGEDVYRLRAGNCFAISNYFVGLTRYVGLKSYYYYFPFTRRNYFSKDVLITTSHIVCGVDIGMRDLAFVIDYFPDANIPYETLFKLRRIKKISDLEAAGLFYSNLGVKAMMSQHYEKAEFLLLFAEKLFPTSSNITNNLAILYKRLKDYDKAADFLIKALKYSRNKQYVVGNLLRIRNNLSPLKKKEVMNVIKDKLDDNYYWHLLKAEEYMKAKDFDMALKEIKKADSLSPENRQVYSYYIRYALKVNDRKMLERYLKKVQYFNSAK